MNKNIVIIGGAVVVLAVIVFLVIANMTPTPAIIPVSGVPNGTTTAIPTTPPSTTLPSVAGAPVAVTGATVAPTATTAVVTGSVNPNGAITSYWYEYGPSSTFGQKTSTEIVGSGFVAIPTPGYITGLLPNTTYYFRLMAQNQFGLSTGIQRSVTTTASSPAPVGGVPQAHSLAATTITNTTANLGGSVNPNQAATQYWFEYGKTNALGNVTNFVSVGSGNSTLTTSAAITGIDAGTTYYYRINAQNQFGTVNGAIMTFKTSGSLAVAAPVVTTQLVRLVATTTATLVGTVNPSHAQTSFWFEYSTDAQFGSTALHATPKKSVGAGTDTTSVQTPITKISPNTTYYVRIVAQNTGGTTRGVTQTFITT